MEISSDDGDITFPYVLLTKKNRTLEVVPAETVTGARALQNKGSKTSPEQSYIWIGKLDCEGKHVIVKLTAHISGTRKTYPNGTRATDSDEDRLQEVSSGEESTSEKSDAGDTGAPNSDAGVHKTGCQSNRLKSKQKG